MAAPPLIVLTNAAAAQVPDRYQAAVGIAYVAAPACTARIYRPLMPAHDYASDVPPPYAGVEIAGGLPCEPDPTVKHGASRRSLVPFAEREGHMLEAFSIDTDDRTVSEPVPDWINSVKQRRLSCQK